MSQAGAARNVAAVVGVVLLGIVLGRLILERTGTGLVLFMVSLPIVFLLCAALLGFGRAAILLGLFAGTALLMRVIVLQTGWVVLLVAPVVGLTAYILASTIHKMRQGAPRREEEKE